MRPLTSLLRICLTTAIAAGALWAEEEAAAPEDSAEIEGYFISRLAEIETLTTGVHELSQQEQANLENLIAYEVNSARAGGVNGFAKTFSERRSDAELEATGIQRMSDEQRERLDQHIAGFIADQPVSYVYQGNGSGGSNGRADTRPFKGKGPLLNVRNSVTLEVGTGSGGTYYGGSVTTVISDPKGRFNAVISYGTMRGDLPYYDYRRGPYRDLSRP
ncbi:MAG: hypothetical protein SynsKO_10690 [Synoicihabitans sp.]